MELRFLSSGNGKDNEMGENSDIVEKTGKENGFELMCLKVGRVEMEASFTIGDVSR